MPRGLLYSEDEARAAGEGEEGGRSLEARSQQSDHAYDDEYPDRRGHGSMRCATAMLKGRPGWAKTGSSAASVRECRRKLAAFSAFRLHNSSVVLNGPMSCRRPLNPCRQHAPPCSGEWVETSGGTGHPKWVRWR